VPRSYDFAIKKNVGKAPNAWLTKTLLSRYIGGNSLQIVPLIMPRARSFFSTIVVFPQQRGSHKCGTKKHVRGLEKPEGRRN